MFLSYSGYLFTEKYVSASSAQAVRAVTRLTVYRSVVVGICLLCACAYTYGALTWPHEANFL